MHPEHNEKFPDDREFNPSSSFARIERQLKLQQPQPVALDAEAILRAALEDDCGAGAIIGGVDRRDRDSNDRRGRWFALGAACIGGALAGSLLTAFVMSRPVNSDMAVNSIRTTSGTTVTEVIAGRSEALAGGGSERTRQDDDRDRVPRWSQSEFLVSNRILNLGRTAPGVPLLQAGSYVRLSATAGSWPVVGTPVARPIDRSDTTSPESDTADADTADAHAADAHVVDGDAPVAGEIKRNDLLRELLRDQPGSTL